jgi:two-component system chemotaxis response regulator CheB
VIRVLVADDSPTARALLVAMLAADPELEVAGEAADGLQAVEAATRLRPDVITMDIQMPNLDGIGATRQIMAVAPAPIVIVSGLDVREVAISLEALRAGAVALFPKPSGPGATDFERHAADLRATVKTMSRVRLARPRPPLAPAVPRRAPRPPAEVVAIAASTGGPGALHRILAALPATFPAPILVVQHIAEGFAEGLARWLGGATPLGVRVAASGEPLRAGTVYVAPDHAHLGVAEGRIALSDAPAVEGFRPSGSVLFESVARSYGSGACAAILTGIGRDGVAGLRAVRAAGGRILAQDETTSVVFGMPGAALAEGLADELVPLDGFAQRLIAATAR